jgi:Leucine-rich repeat (LRR) protein
VITMISFLKFITISFLLLKTVNKVVAIIGTTPPTTPAPYYNPDSSECASYDPCFCERNNSRRLLETILDYNYSPELYNDLVFIFDINTTVASEEHTSFIINCSDHEFKKVPYFRRLGYSNQPMISSLDLSNNHLERISESQFYGLLIQSIDLSSNRIYKISNNAFNGLLHDLVLLKLNNNRLTSQAFPIYFTSKLRMLQALFLASNAFDKIPNGLFF